MVKGVKSGQQKKIPDAEYDAKCKGMYQRKLDEDLRYEKVCEPQNVSPAP